MFNVNGFLHRLFHKESLCFLLSLAVILSAPASLAAETIHHQLHVKLHPAETSISVSDIVQFPAGTNSAEFSLRASLSVKAVNTDLSSAGESGQSTPVR